MASDVLRDREQEQPNEAPPSSDFATLAKAAEPALPSLEQRLEKIDTERTAARQKSAEAGEGVVEAMERRREGMAPALAAQPPAMPPPPGPTVLPEPPSRGLHAFLAPAPGEDPVNTIMKLTQGIALMAGGFTGLARGDATAALAGLRGALAGWHDGDKVSADRHFADWKAKTDKMIFESEERHRTYRDILEQTNLSWEQQQKLLELAGISYGHEVGVATARKQNAAEVMQELDTDYKQTLTLVDHANKLKVMEAEKQRDREWKEHLTQMQIDAKAESDRERRADKREAAAAKAKEQEEQALPDEELATLAQLELSGGSKPTFGMGKSRERSRYLGIKAREAAKLGGPAAVTARLAALSGLKEEQKKVMVTRGLVEAFSKTAEKNLRDAETLSKEVDREGAPMLNKWLLQGRKAWAGDQKVVDFDVAVRTAINETARVLNSANASGVISDSARHEIEDMLNTSLNPKQFTSAINRLLREMNNRREAYDDQIKIIGQQIRDTATLSSEPAGAPPLPPGWSIKKKETATP